MTDWSERLYAFLDSRADTLFEWGRHDCVTFAADAVLAQTGWDPLGGLRGAWRTAYQATKATAKLGGVYLGIGATGLQRLATPLLAQRGDLVVVTNANRLVAGVCLGPEVACAASKGYTLLPLTTADAAWRV